MPNRPLTQHEHPRAAGRRGSTVVDARLGRGAAAKGTAGVGRELGPGAGGQVQGVCVRGEQALSRGGATCRSTGRSFSQDAF